MLSLSTPYNYEAELYLLEEYMKSYIDVIASFCKDGNKDSKYIKGSLTYQQVLLTQTLGEHSLFVEVRGFNEIFLDRDQCICDFDSFKEALFGELVFLKEKVRVPKDINLCEMPKSLLEIIEKNNKNE